MVDQRRSLGGWTDPRAPKWVHKLSLFSMSLGQPGWQPTLHQTRLAFKTPSHTASTLTYQVRSNEELCEDNGYRR